MKTIMYITYYNGKLLSCVNSRVWQYRNAGQSNGAQAHVAGIRRTRPVRSVQKSQLIFSSIYNKIRAAAISILYISFLAKGWLTTYLMKSGTRLPYWEKDREKTEARRRTDNKEKGDKQERNENEKVSYIVCYNKCDMHI